MAVVSDTLGQSDGSLRCSGLRAGATASTVDVSIVSSSAFSAGTAATSAARLQGQLIRIPVAAPGFANLTLSFLEPGGGNPVNLQRVLLYVLDMDQTASSRSGVSVQGFDAVSLSPSSSLLTSYDTENNRWWFVSGAMGTASNAPSSFHDLNPAQLDEAVTFSFQAISEAHLLLEVTCDACPAGSAHAFLLGLDACRTCGGGAASAAASGPGAVGTSLTSFQGSVMDLRSELFSAIFTFVSSSGRSLDEFCTLADANGDGRIDQGELVGAASAAGVQLGDPQSAAILANASAPDGLPSGNLAQLITTSVAESRVAALAALGGYVADAGLDARTFAGAADADGDGLVSRREFLTAARGSGSAASDLRLSAVYASMADQGLSSVSVPSFASLIAATAGGSTSSTGTGTQSLPSSGARLCMGTEQEWVACVGLPPCHTCEPQDCRFGPWGDWADFGGCTGLCYRRRGIARSNNECGRPCDGAEEMTMQCPKAECVPSRPKDCEFSAWSTWGPCTNKQQRRSRSVAEAPLYGGHACLGDLEELRACDVVQPKDCVLNAWSVWAACSASCGGGYHERTRRPVQFADESGRACADMLVQVQECATQPCPGPACKLGDWSAWTGCDAASPQQRVRRRPVSTGADVPGGSSSGDCSGSLEEVANCPALQPQPCALSPWTQWLACDRTCDGGQTYRERRWQRPALNGGACPAAALGETRACGQQPCSAGARDCRLGDWRAWSACSSEQGEGLRQRTRAILQQAGPGGAGCLGPLEQAESCRGDGAAASKPVDCEWDQWGAWSACTCTCGGGAKRRNRSVRRSPANGGRLCPPADKSEVAPCNAQPCSQSCVDGRWGDWSAWAACSSSCGPGLRWRHRDVLQQASDCGAPAVGQAQEWAACNGTAAGEACGDRDCRLSAWSVWSDCSCTCFGIRERNRIVEQYYAGRGRPCVDQDLRQIEPCNPILAEEPPGGCEAPTQDCSLMAWSAWSDCPVTCGGGNRFRQRSLSPASAGLACNASTLKETVPCSVAPCRESSCVDCLWGAWGDWGTCTKCGGQRYRNRGIVRLPNACGRRCEARPAKEVSNCTSDCSPVQLCAWKAWSSWSGCSTDCGSATRMRQRSLFRSSIASPDTLFQVDAQDGGIACAGTQVDLEQCFPIRPCSPRCVPQDCAFSAWTDWREPTCIGLCERTRLVQVANNECGSTCEGPLVQTKACMSDLPCTERQDCRFSPWGEWTVAAAANDGTEVYRARSVAQVPANGGQPCDGALREVRPVQAAGQLPPVPCRVADWEPWSPCSQTCGGGWHERRRQISRPPAQGGEPCEEALVEGEPCAAAPCPAAECRLGAWGLWSTCMADGQQYRQRPAQQGPAGTAAGGAACAAFDRPFELEETRRCGAVRVDCRLSEWTAWDQCDRSCGWGQQQRHRQVVAAPENGGQPCPENLRELRGCNQSPCQAGDCRLSDWGPWSTCPATCGAGQQRRQRQVAAAASAAGRPCEGSLSATRACLTPSGEALPPCPVKGCLWLDWSVWSGCSCSCGGGQRTRTRGIKQMPEPGGGMCPVLSKEEVQPCSTQPCDDVQCQDGVWGDWGSWSQCSASCEGGVTFRHRVVAREANQCGNPPVGLTHDLVPCNVGARCEEDLDCVFSAWDPWGDCTRSCDGVKRRERRILIQGRGRGRWCLGATKETAPCNPSAGEQQPAECQIRPTDCILGTWGAWSACPVTCGAGQVRRERVVEQVARYGGAGCQGGLVETAACATRGCPQDAPPRDCLWSDWSPWGACSKCAGQRTRFRQVSQESRNGGRPCQVGAAEETGPCPRQCHEELRCAWSAWGAWGECTEVCGTGGKRSRTRTLGLRPASEVEDAIGRAEEQPGAPVPAGRPWLLGAASAFGGGPRLDVLAAFCCGYLGRAAILSLAAGRADRGRGRRQEAELRPGSRLLGWWASVAGSTAIGGLYHRVPMEPTEATAMVAEA